MPTAERYHQYQILRREDGSLWELGRGAMGITYKAFDTNLRVTVALKVINSAYLDSDTARQRFLREARAAVGLQHPNVAAVFNLGTEQDKFYYVMEFIDGETVDARVRRQGPLEPVEGLNIALHVARALAVAAKQQLVHRDLKPTNLMLMDKEGESIVKVIDFGLAKVAKDSGEDSATLTVGGFIGTPHFASPEQIEEGEVDIRSDIYSLGATLYFVLTGQSPFSGSVGQVMSQHLYKPLSIERLTALPRSVVSLLQQMMEKDRNDRPQTPQVLQRAILACLEEIRASESRRAEKPDEQTSAFETVALSSATGQPLATGAVLAQNYKLIKELPESPQGRMFLADDLLRQRRVSVLVLSREFLSEDARLANLEEAVQRLRIAPHPMLREVYSFETAADCSFLVEEYTVGPSLLDVIRTRSVLSAPEVLRLLRVLAPLADHASGHRLQHLDLTLSGIHLTSQASTESGTPDLLQRPLTAWHPLEATVDAIDFSFLSSDFSAWTGSATRMRGASGSGSRPSYVRMLSLLAYELLGGPWTKLVSTGQYTPIAALTQEGNLTLRRALADECPSAGNLIEQLAAVVDTRGPAYPLANTSSPPPPTATSRSPGRFGSVRGWTQQSLNLPPLKEIATLTFTTEPAGASVLLDGKLPQQPPATFMHIPFGSHQLTAFLAGYEPVTQDLQIRERTEPTIPVKLSQSDENSPQYLTAYVQFVQSLNTSGATTFAGYRDKLASIIETLRNRTLPLSRDEFRLFYKKSITDAADTDLDILPAILLLGENAQNDSEAMKWFDYAVKRKNDSYAMMKVGRLYLKRRTPEDSVKGYEWIKRAYDSGNQEAGAYLGECLLNGLGTKQDLLKGENIIMLLANQNLIPAMVIAGSLRQAQADYKLAKAKESAGPLRQALNEQASKLYSEAGQWWAKSAAKGNYNGLAHLGQMYEEGLAGYEKSEEEAEKRYKEGVSHGNALSMFYYGLMLWKKPDRQSEAETLIARAAAMGLPPAISWSREHNLQIPEQKSDDDLQ